jgi:polyhydroxyalkanoate synthesis regulator phasin
MEKERQEKKEKKGQDQFLYPGMKSAEEFWKEAVKMWPLNLAAFPAQAGRLGEEAQKGMADYWESLREFWQGAVSLARTVPVPGGEQAAKEGIPLFLSDPFRPLLEGFMQLQRQWMDAGSKAAAPVDGDEVGQTLQHVSTTLFEMYGEEFRKLLNLPQLGLTRFYQERANLAIEKFNAFQSAIHTFTMILIKPMGKAFQEMQDEVRRLGEQGEDVLQDTKKYYQIWMKKMEDQYLQLLRSPEYTESLGRTLAALKDYRVAREQWMIDLLQDVPVPTNKDMDVLYKELYDLKKKIRQLEKRGGKGYDQG